MSSTSGNSLDSSTLLHQASDGDGLDMAAEAKLIANDRHGSGGNPSGRNANEVTLNRLYRQYYGPLVSFLTRRYNIDTDSAKEVAQETFLSLFQHIRRGGSLDHERGLVYTIAKSRLIDLHRRRKSRQESAHSEFEEEAVSSGSASQDQLVFQQQAMDELEAAVLTLPKKCGQIFILRMVKEMSHAEIAAHYGISISMVEKHLGKAHKLVRKYMRSKNLSSLDNTNS